MFVETYVFAYFFPTHMKINQFVFYNKFSRLNSKDPLWITWHHAAAICICTYKYRPKICIQLKICSRTLRCKMAMENLLLLGKIFLFRAIACIFMYQPINLKHTLKLSWFLLMIYTFNNKHIKGAFINHVS